MSFGLYNPYVISQNVIRYNMSRIFEATAVEEEIKDRIAQGDVQGRDVEYWKVLDRIKIVRIKG